MRDLEDVIYNSHKANERISAADKCKMIRKFTVLPDLILSEYQLQDNNTEKTEW